MFAQIHGTCKLGNFSAERIYLMPIKKEFAQVYVIQMNDGKKINDHQRAGVVEINVERPIELLKKFLEMVGDEEILVNGPSQLSCIKKFSSRKFVINVDKYLAAHYGFSSIKKIYPDQMYGYWETLRQMYAK